MVLTTESASAAAADAVYIKDPKTKRIFVLSYCKGGNDCCGKKKVTGMVIFVYKKPHQKSVILQVIFVAAEKSGVDAASNMSRSVPPLCFSTLRLQCSVFF